MLTKKAVRSLLVSLAIIIASTTASLAQTSALRSQTPSRIVSAIDDSVRVTIKGSAPSQARPENDIGPLDPATRLERMILVIGASPDQEYQARTLLDSQQTKGSPDYHHWLTPEEYGQKFGPSSQDLAQVTGWLTQHGFTVTSVAKSQRWLEFSGTSAQVESAFQTQMRQYLVAGQVHIANASNISIPAALSPVVKGIASLHNFFSKPTFHRYTPNANIPVDSKGDNIHAIAPADLAAIYDLNALYAGGLNGLGQTIAIVAVSNINVSDVITFQGVFGLPKNVPNIILNGPDPGVDTVFGAGVEASLDTEWSGAVARDATIDVVVSGGSLTTDPVLLGSTFIVDQNLASVMNASFSACEAALDGNPVDGNAFWAAVWEQAAAQGISVFVSSGDSGAAGCDPAGEALTGVTGGTAISGFASTPFNTAVGGTEFNESLGLDSTFWTETPNVLASANGYIPEMVWNDSCTPTEANTVCPQLNPADGQFLILAGGGGLSTVYSTPSYQTTSGIPGLNSTVLKGARGIPDISLDSAVQHDPYILCFTSTSTPDCQLPLSASTFQNLAGGTSFASPEFAGIMAIVDQKLGGRQGLANYTLYPLAAAANLSSCNSNNRLIPATPTSCVFNDVTVGNNGVPGNDIGFAAVTGYDLATGLGSVDANNLVTAWANLAKGFQGSTTTLTTNPTTVNITHGQNLSVSVSVARQGTTGTPSGNVSLVAQGGNLPTGVGIAFEPLSGSSGTGTAGPVNVNNLPGGTAYNLSSVYPGDGVFAGSTSSNVTVTVNPENSSTVLQSLIFNLNTGNLTTGNTVAYGDGVNVLALDAHTAGVSGLIPSNGNVTFTFNGTPISPFAIDNSGIGEYIDCFFPQVNCLTPGTYTVTAAYSGDGPLSYNASPASGSISITVTKGNPSVTVLPALLVVSAGEQFTIAAQVQPSPFGTITPTGTVQFLDGSTALGSPVTINASGQASTTATLNSGGNHSITAQYSGDTTYNTATSSAQVVTVTAPFNFSATSQSQTIAAGGTATYNLTLTGTGGFSGAVTITCSGAPGGATCSPNPATASLSTTTTSVPVVITVSNTANARLSPLLFKQLPFVFAGLLGAAILVLRGKALRRKPRQRLLAIFAIFVIAGLSACGGGSNPPPPPTNATLTVTGTNGSLSSTITLNLTVTH